MAELPILVWLRADLRIADNPALHAAAETGAPVLVLFVMEEDEPGIRPLGGAAKWWLHHSLVSLERDLKRLGLDLLVERGAPSAVLPAVVERYSPRVVHWNRRVGHPRRVDDRIAAALEKKGVSVRTFKGNHLFDPGEVLTGTGKPFRVFTPFWRAALGAPPGPPLSAPRRPKPFPVGPRSSIDALALLPTKPDWAAGLRESWTPGEAAAEEKLDAFFDRIGGYAAGRDVPSIPATSRLSPHLRFGEISPRRIWSAVAARVDGVGAERFIAEIGWREFCNQLLDQFPDMATEPMRPEFADFPWLPEDHETLAAWREGRTGYPIVDAGMRQLWRTGWMHNRVRMVVASFLTKHLLQDWRIGEAWFWDTLVDGDPASNPANWQWVAGCGADAAPYFRIFNPLMQAEKFDPDGKFVRSEVRELADVPDKFVHMPAEAPVDLLSRGGLGAPHAYPPPIVEHGFARARALKAYAGLRKPGGEG